MNRNAKTHRLWLLILLLSTTACVNNDFDNLPKPPAGAAVSFRTETLDDFATRSSGYTTTGTYAIGSMGIYAGYTSAAWNGSTAPHNFFDNLPVNRTGDASSWSYGNEQLWPGSGYLTFFAYAPHSENTVYAGNKPTITTTTGTPRLAYTIASTHHKQVDLLVATPVKDQTKRDYVTIPLRHALTKIAFSARVANAPAADTQIRVTNIQLSGLYGSGSIPMDGQNRQWDTTGDNNNHSYTVTNTTGEGLKTLSLTDTYQPLTPANGHLFLMPQTLVEGKKDTGATITVTYQTQVAAGTPEEKSFDLELSRAITRFNPGMAYNLMFVIDNGVTLIVAPTPWDKTDVEVDIKNRILNVSRIEAAVYPGVATRIWFWSNQPKDSVYVRTNGNIDNARYPTGTAYTINDAFQELSLAGAANLTYRGINEAPIGTDPALERGEGYIDVWHKLDASGNPVAGSPAVSLTDGDKRHLWLNASGLTRNVLLNSIIRNNSTTPYIGTFHRWNETGERIITWGAPYKWTATILYPLGTGADILIDNQPSPYMTTGQLYGDHDVGDPEAAQLSHTATTAISGKGRVYFRVGWKYRLGSATTAPRYGCIEVKEYDLNSNLTATRTLYIRQGELADYVYAPDGTRTLAVKWSPYNLTDPLQGAGGNTFTNHNQLTVNGGRFTQYPTQAGYFFAWASTTTEQERRAYHPQSPIGGITGWNTASAPANDTWNKKMADHETCPPGYRRPFNTSVTTAVSQGSNINSEFKHSLTSSINTGSESSTGNYLFGYYADGFFDRRKIVSDVQVSSGKYDVAYVGGLFYHPTTFASLFFPAAGRRVGSGNGAVDYTGSNSTTPGLTNVGFYSSSAANSADGNMIYHYISKDYASVNAFAKTDAMSIRCIRNIGFVTDLKPDTEVLVPTALSFNVASPDIKATTVMQYTNYIIAAIGAMSDPAPAAYNIRARVTFTGTVTSVLADATAVIDGLLTHAYMASGSTVTYDFSHASLTWDTDKVIKISVDNANWEYRINGSTWTDGNFGLAATLTAKGKIELRKK